MGTEERSRDAHEPRKRYAAVGMQQGRVFLDDDFNAAEAIRLEDDREVNLDVIGPVGSPDDGFRVANGRLTGGRVDFDLLAGTLYLSGQRVWNGSAASFALQPDWLNQLPADRPAPAAGRVDLVYLESWRQPVTAVEDAELFEVALAGPDTSTRTRTMWRVRVAPGAAGDDCPAAWRAVTEGWTAAGLGTVDATGERVVDAELTIGFTGGDAGDLCSPAIAGGFLGAENQTIRVQLVDADHFTWGFDNGAPLYRATLGADQRTITLLTDPRDQTRWPMAGQIVEVLPWSAVLVNGEKLAEESGHLARVATSYDPDTHRFVLSAATAVPAGFGTAWQGRADAASLGAPFFYVRLWDRGDDTASPPAIPIAPAPVALGTTGLTVAITGGARVRGDHWIVSARPRTPDQVVPWELEVGRGPHGTRRFYAPLALVRWRADGTFDVLHDCRPHFLPLTRLRGCCTHTVGDEVHSFGRFTSIQAAVDALPAEGGKVCVLPGVYTETVVLWNRANVTIEGCGARSLLRPDPDLPWTILVVGGRDLAIRDLGFDTGDAFGIVVLDAAQGQPGTIYDAAWVAARARARRLRFERLAMRVRGRSAIAILGGLDVRITDSEIVAGPLPRVIERASDLGRWPAILSFADDALIEGNAVRAPAESLSLPGAETPAGDPTFTRTALGGIQIGGGAEGVEIRRNRIEGGNGDGITLGSWAWAPAETADGGAWDELVRLWRWVAGGFHITINDEGCIEIEWDPPPPDGGGPPLVPVSMGAVERVRIVDNHIRAMGRSGIGIARFFDLTGRDELIVVRDLHVQDNRIHGCLRLPIPEVPERMREHAAMGAITLAEVERLVVRGNDIAGNGRRHIDPICGVFALVATGAVIEGNRIVDNGPPAATQEPVRPGWRGGVVLARAFAPAVPLPVGRRTIQRQDGQPAVRIADNVIVVPEGRPILVLAHGAVVIADNHLTTRGVGLADLGALLGAGGSLPELAAAIGQGPIQTMIDLLGGVGTFVLDTGVSNELGYLQLRLAFLNVAKADVAVGLDPRPPLAASGNIAFHGNQVGVDLLRPPNNLVLSGLALLGLDDIQGSENQLEIDRGGDRILVGWYSLALSVRITDNRVKEVIAAPAAALAGTSITSVGLFMNMTTGNQTTRCIVALGLQRTEQPNHVLIELIAPDFCGRSRTIGAAFEQANLDLAVVGG